MVDRSLSVFAICILLPMYAVANDRSDRKDPVNQAFGMTLGEAFNPDGAISSRETTSGEKLYEYNPPNPYSKLTHYFVIITPISNRIAEIWAIGDLKEQERCESELDTIVRIFEKKYPTAEKKDNFILIGEGRMYEQGDTSVIIRCDLEFQSAPLYVQYRSEKMLELAKEERAEKTIQEEGGISGF